MNTVLFCLFTRRPAPFSIKWNVISASTSPAKKSILNLSNVLAATATSVHCFLNAEGLPIPVKKYFPTLDAILRQKTRLSKAGLFD